MPEVAVVTDSTAYLPPELVEQHGIEIVPLYIVFGGDRTVHETEITDYPAFFEELRQAESLPTTSQPSVGDFIAGLRAAAGGRQGRRLDPHLRRACPAPASRPARPPRRSSATARAASGCA